MWPLKLARKESARGGGTYSGTPMSDPLHTERDGQAWERAGMQGREEQAHWSPVT